MGGKGSREIAFDIMKGIGILLVIVGHSTYPPGWIHTWIFSFHMPLFFLVAGYFFKQDSDRVAFLKKNARRLLIPYFVTVFIVFFLCVLSAIKNSDPDFWKTQAMGLLFPSGLYSNWMLRWLRWTDGVGPPWFLIALFWSRVFFNRLLCAKVSLWAIIIIGVACTGIDRYVLNLPFSIMPGASAMVFLVIGYLSRMQSVAWYIVLLCVVFWVLACRWSELDMRQCKYGLYPVDVLGACGGTLVTYYVSHFLSKFKSYFSGIPSFFSWAGRNSLFILCIHTIILIFHPFKLLSIIDVWYVILPLEIVVPLGVVYIGSKIKPARWVFG